MSQKIRNALISVSNKRNLKNLLHVLKKLKVNQSKYSFLMNENAGIHDDLIITKILFHLKSGWKILM